jgi:hypothetical protein
VTPDLRTLPDVDYSILPEHMRDVARGYVERGYPPGGFLRAVLANDLVGAFGRADGPNAHCMGDWATWLFNEAPSACWGSSEKVTAWLARFVDGIA